MFPTAEGIIINPKYFPQLHLCIKKSALFIPIADALTAKTQRPVNLLEVEARNLFDNMSNRDVVAWNALISGLSLHGLYCETSNRALLDLGDYYTVPSAPQQPEAVVHNIVLWRNGFSVNDCPLRRLDDPENVPFLESIRKSECPKELEPVDRRSSVHVNLTRRDENCPEPKERQVAFLGMGRTLGSITPPSGAPEPSDATPLNAAPTPSMGLVADQSLPSTSIKLRVWEGNKFPKEPGKRSRLWY